jgi:hypothetical protein
MILNMNIQNLKECAHFLYHNVNMLNIHIFVYMKKRARLEYIRRLMANRSSLNAYELAAFLDCSVTLAYQLLHQLSILEPNYFEYDRGILRKKPITQVGGSGSL